MNFIKLLLFCIVFQSCVSQSKQPVSKINGVSFVASSDSISQEHVTPVVNVSANYAALMPFSVLKTISSPDIYYSQNRQWFGETKLGLKQYAKWLRKNNINVMMKPQVWVRNGEFTGTIKMENEADWLALEKSYSVFILDYAETAQELNAEIFCIGTELELFIKNRPDYWTHLIKNIKKVYNGKLTYAANWDEYKRTPFWADLDFIGVDAYFPLSDKKTPTLEDGLLGWQKHKSVLKTFSDKYSKPILFTEFGYRSVDFAGRKPWVSDRAMKGTNMVAQENLTKSLYETMWHEPWFSGGFVWKWFINYNEVGGLENDRFTPQNKPTEAVIKSYYEKH